ncbi:MAG: hypothetical protein FWE88_07695 [Phycisphaerae bacterium]|nr:hypothetical protein [Phycisphaerae bacterium]
MTENPVKPRSKLSRIIIASVSLLVILAVLSLLFINHLAKIGIEAGGSAALGVPTRVGAVSIGLFDGQASFADLVVGNPEGFSSRPFLSLMSGSMSLTLPSLARDVVEIPHFLLEDIVLNIEKKDGRANYQVIMDGMKRSESSNEPGKRFIIREVAIRNVTIHAEGPAGVPVTVVVPEILLTDVGTSDEAGVNTAEVVNILVKTIFASAIENGAGLLPDDMLNDMQAGMGQLKSLAGQGLQGAAGQAVEGAKKLTEGINKGVGGLLK